MNPANPIRILLIEDSALQAELIEHELLTKGGKKFDIYWANRLKLGLEHLKKKNTDVVLSDLGLPDSMGIETIKTLLHEAEDIPVVILTGSEEDERVALEAIRLGAQDYLTKDMDVRLIRRVLAYAIQRKQLELQVREYSHKLEAANEDLEAFAYTVSHDLRAPLSTIDARTRTLLEESESHLDQKAKQGLDQILKDTEYMSHLLNDLLALSRLGALSIHESEIKIEDLSHQVIEDLRAENPLTKFEIKINPMEATWGDLTLIHQVVQNLISNAIKYAANEEHPRIEIGMIPAEKEKIFYVKDNGMGFDPKDTDQLFGIFKRLPNAKNIEGVGCGLAIVARIIRKHGGRVWAEGKPGEGATFYFSLPEKYPTPLVPSKEANLS